VRASAVDRWFAPRTIHAVQVDGHDIRVKRGPARAKAEFDDAAAAARALGRPVRDVIEAAERDA
jgi:uncharacterized protein (DUF111 family)